MVGAELHDLIQDMGFDIRLIAFDIDLLPVGFTGLGQELAQVIDHLVHHLGSIDIALMELIAALAQHLIKTHSL